MSWVVYAVLSAVALSAVAIMQKRALRDEHALEFVTVTTVLRVILFYAFFWTKIDWTISNGQLLGLCVTAVLGATGFWLISKALRRQDVSIVFPIMILDAAVSAILALIILHEALSAKQVLGLVVLVTGTYLLHTSESTHPEASSWKTMLFPFRELWRRPGGRFAFLGMGAFAVSAVLDRALLKTTPWTTYLAYVLPLMMAYFLIASAARGHTFSLYRRNWRQTMPWVLAASVLYLISNVANVIATSLAAVGLVVAIKRSGTLIDVLVSGKIFHEQAIIHKALAAAVMLVGLFLILT